MTLAIPQDFREITIETPDGVLNFTGKLLGTVDNERRGRPRWAEIELYKYVVTDEDDPMCGSQMYLLHTMGHSVVYHRVDGGCNRGIIVPVEEFPLRAEFPEDLEPCSDMIIRGNTVFHGCYPDEWHSAPPGSQYALEVLRHLRFMCKTADDVLNQLRRPGKAPCGACGGGMSSYGCRMCHGRGFVNGPPVLSTPGQRLVEMVKYKDAEIAKATQNKVRL